MNYQKLFEAQRKLDEHIVKEKGLEGQDLLPKKILALQTELGELANEWRGFKFWSHDQEPRTWISTGICMYCAGTGNQNWDDDTAEDEDCDWCGGEGETTKNPLLEEYVDCLHFILSVGLEITEPDMIDLKRWNLTKADNITEQFLWLMADVTELYHSLCNDGFSKFDYEFLLLRFIHLGEMLGFTWEQVEQAYMEKNRINYQRQETNY